MILFTSRLCFAVFLLAISSVGLACMQATDSELRIEYEKYILENGLEVILHTDRSDPIVSVAMTYHVGSARETKGRTGFAHLFEHLLFPEDHPYNWQVIGSLEDIDRAELQDVKDFYYKWYGPNNATLVIAGDFDVKLTSIEPAEVADIKAYYESRFSAAETDFHVVGMVSQQDALAPLAGITRGWKPVTVDRPEFTLPPPRESSIVYFVDVPGAKQSVLRVGYLAIEESNPDFLKANAMNFKLGGGGFASELLQVLREEEGYTYIAETQLSRLEALGYGSPVLVSGE